MRPFATVAIVRFSGAGARRNARGATDAKAKILQDEVVIEAVRGEPLSLPAGWERVTEFAALDVPCAVPTVTSEDAVTIAVRTSWDVPPEGPPRRFSSANNPPAPTLLAGSNPMTYYTCDSNQQDGNSA